MLVLVLIALNGIFVAGEFALVAVDGSRIDVMAERGNASAKLVRSLLRRLSFNLGGAQLGLEVEDDGVRLELLVGDVRLIGVGLLPVGEDRRLVLQLGGGAGAGVDLDLAAAQQARLGDLDLRRARQLDFVVELERDHDR